MKLATLEVSYLIGKLIMVFVQDLIKGISEEVEYHKKEVQILRVEKEQLENVLTDKAQNVRDNL